MAATTLQSALVPWGVDFTPEGAAAFEQSGVASSAAAKEYVLTSDLRRLHLAPHPAEPTNFSALLSKSLQAPPEVVAYAATNDAPPASGSVASSYCLKKALLCMVLSFQDVRLPTKDVEEDFSGGAQGIKGNQRRLLSLKLTDGRGASFTGIELRFCPQLDAVPLLPGVKLLLLPGLVLYRGMALLSPQGVQNLGGGAVQLREAFNLKAGVQERRKLVQHILNENAQLQQRIKEDKCDTGPPKFVPFSASASVQSFAVQPVMPTKEKQQQKLELPRHVLKREVLTVEQVDKDSAADSASRSVFLSSKTGNLKHDRLRQLEKVNLNNACADRITYENKPGRAGRGRRQRREREEDLTEYMRPSGGKVTYSLFDLIKADAEQTNSTAATTLLYGSETYENDASVFDASLQSNSALPPVSPGADRVFQPPAARDLRNATAFSRGGDRAEGSRPRGHRGGGRGRGRGRGSGRPS